MFTSARTENVERVQALFDEAGIKPKLPGAGALKLIHDEASLITKDKPPIMNHNHNCGLSKRMIIKKHVKYCLIKAYWKHKKSIPIYRTT